MKISPPPSIYRLNPTARWSDATVHNGTAYFVEVATEIEQDLTSQVTQILTQAEVTLSNIGSNKSLILSATIYLTDRKHASVFNSLWEKWLPLHCAPSRACVIAELMDPNMLLEIAFVVATEGNVKL